MNDNIPGFEDKNHAGRESTEPEIIAVVQCEGFRCLACRDARNIWRDFHTGKELPEIKEVVFRVAL
jgi:hypothetical protein